MHDVCECAEFKSVMAVMFALNKVEDEEDDDKVSLRIGLFVCVVMNGCICVCVVMNVCICVCGYEWLYLCVWL